MEIERAVKKVFWCRDVDDFHRDELVRWGIEDAVRMSGTPIGGHEIVRRLRPNAADGVPAEVAATLQALFGQLYLEPEMSVLAIVDSLDAEAVAEGRRNDQRSAAALERARETDGRAIRLRILMGEEEGELREVLESLGVEPSEFSRWLDTHLEDFVEHVPTVDVAQHWSWREIGIETTEQIATT